MAGSESSDEEDFEKFAAITDIVNSEVVKNNGYSSHLIPEKSKPSLRHWREDEELACSTSELITPEFRQHVAKKLSKFLDKNYSCTEEVHHLHNGHGNSLHKSSGIRLMLSSNERLIEESSYTIKNTNKKKSSDSSESDTDEEELKRLTEAAVSGYSIIEKGASENREQAEDEAIETDSIKRKKEKRRKKEKSKKVKGEEDKKEKKHKKHKKEKHKEKT